MIDKEYHDVTEFNKKFGLLVNSAPTHLTRRKLRERLNFMQEELDEFNSATMIQDLPAMADALIDLVYVAKGTAIQMGLPWQALWDDVQRANMTKVSGASARLIKDVIKPPGWIGPRTGTILREHGYVEADFLSDDKVTIDERKCHDD